MAKLYFVTLVLHEVIFILFQWKSLIFPIKTETAENSSSSSHLKIALEDEGKEGLD